MQRRQQRRSAFAWPELLAKSAGGAGDWLGGGHWHRQQIWLPKTPLLALVLMLLVLCCLLVLLPLVLLLLPPPPTRRGSGAALAPAAAAAAAWGCCEKKARDTLPVVLALGSGVAPLAVEACNPPGWLAVRGSCCCCLAEGTLLPPRWEASRSFTSSGVEGTLLAARVEKTSEEEEEVPGGGGGSWGGGDTKKV